MNRLQNLKYDSQKYTIYEYLGKNFTYFRKDYVDMLKYTYPNMINHSGLNDLSKLQTNSDILNFINIDTNIKLSLIDDNFKKNNTKTLLHSYYKTVIGLILVLQLDIETYFKENKQVDIFDSNDRILYDLSNLYKLNNYINKITDRIVNVKDNNFHKVLKFTLKKNYYKWFTFFKTTQWEKYKVKKLTTFKEIEEKELIEDKFKKLNTKELENYTEIPSNVYDLENVKHFAPIAYLRKFDQPRFYDSGKAMKPFFIEMIMKAEKIYGKPFTITSGFRTENYQKWLKSKGYAAATKSSHVVGVACDISLSGMNKKKLLYALKKVGFTRFGIGRSFIHVDAGDKINPNIWKSFSRWNYK